MIVAGFWPDLNAAMAWTISSFGFPASPGSAEPDTTRPCVPWHIAHPAAIDCTPLALVLDGAKFGAGGAGCWARPRGAVVDAIHPRMLAICEFMASSESRGAACKESAETE